MAAIPKSPAKRETHVIRKARPRRVATVLMSGLFHIPSSSFLASSSFTSPNSPSLYPFVCFASVGVRQSGVVTVAVVVCVAEAETRVEQQGGSELQRKALDM
jgi:hypothetical protein